MYKLLKQINNFANGTTTENVYGAFKEENGVMLSFPFDTANTDYQAYLKWVSEGNTPLPADEVA